MMKNIDMCVVECTCSETREWTAYADLHAEALMHKFDFFLGLQI